MTDDDVSDTLGGGEGASKLREFLFELFQGLEQMVVLTVSNFGRGVNLVEPAVALNLRPQLLDPYV